MVATSCWRHWTSQVFVVCRCFSCWRKGWMHLHLQGGMFDTGAFVLVEIISLIFLSNFSAVWFRVSVWPWNPSLIISFLSSCHKCSSIRMLYFLSTLNVSVFLHNSDIGSGDRILWHKVHIWTRLLPASGSSWCTLRHPFCKEAQERGCRMTLFLLSMTCRAGQVSPRATRSEWCSVLISDAVAVECLSAIAIFTTHCFNDKSLAGWPLTDMETLSQCQERCPSLLLFNCTLNSGADWLSQVAGVSLTEDVRK